MKKLNYIYIVFFMSFMANAQLQEENFNASSLPDGWSMTQAESGHSWKFGYTSNLKGSGMQNPTSFQSGGVVFNDYAAGDFNHNVVSLTSPSIDLIKESVAEANLEIVYNLRTFSSDGEFTVNVWDGADWQNVLTVSNDTNEKNSGESTTSTIDVSQYVNNEFKVKFTYDDENSLTWGLGIDNYKLTGVKSSNVDGLESIGFIYYPNPVNNDELTLVSSDDISVVNVFNTIGQLVISEKPVALESKLNMRSLAVGAYVVQVTVGDKKGIFKVIKQ